MAGYISVKNFERFQHYRNRRPAWIKLYNDLLDDYEFARLPDASKWLAVGLWLLASRHDNKIPNDPEWIGRKVNACSPVDLAPLVSAGFITISQDASNVLAGRKQSASTRAVQDASNVLASCKHSASPRALARERERDREEKEYPAAANATAGQEAQELVRRVVELGLGGVPPKGGEYARQVARAKALLKQTPDLDYWLIAAEGMRLLFQYRGQAWDVFNLGRDGAKAYAEARRRSIEPATRSPPDRRAQLLEALAQVRRQDPDFRGGLPDPHATGVEIPKADWKLWDEILANEGLRTIGELAS